jgi:hypothetical protein
MPVATPSAVRKQINSGSTDPLYLLVGEDDVEKSALAAEFAEIVDEGLRAFNVERIPAGDMTSGDRLADGVAGLVSAVRTMPMMVPRRVVTVTQAEVLLVPKAMRRRAHSTSSKRCSSSRSRRRRWCLSQGRSTSAAGCTSF